MIDVTEIPVRHQAERVRSAMTKTPDMDRTVPTRQEWAMPVRRRFPTPLDPRLHRPTWPASLTHQDFVVALGVSPRR